MVAESDPGAGGFRPSVWVARLIARPGFQRVASRVPFGRGLARRDGAGIFDILQGFVAAQVLSALVELGVLRRLLDGPDGAGRLGLTCGIPEDRMGELLQAGAALKLLKRRRDGRFALARKGAAILGVPGLEDMIRHNRAFYADMAEPEALLRGEGETQLQRFWPYVFGGSDGMSREAAERYSDLMARSQELVAQDTLEAVSLKGVGTLLDVGGGSGVFLAAALKRYGGMRGMLLDLPDVMPAAEERLGREGLTGRVALHGGSFREGAVPEGADAISLIRVLYDHDDDTVRALLAKVHDALPEGGRLVISEPMSGGRRPERAGDVYFAFYTMAMGTGRVRSAERIGEMCREAGFGNIRAPKARRPFITSVLTCAKPD
ncbi:methyltransferase [Roseovarius indicus]|uniref:methyltransferase n=2 Tax=Roseovarius indicus TaxID=540747 RepID=UPI00351823E4